MANQIYFNVNEKNQVTSGFRKCITIPEFFQIVLTGCLAQMNAVVAAAPEDQKQLIKEDLYDMFNAGASNILEMFAPDLELRPDLTAQAILEAENKIIEREYQKCVTSPDAQDAIPKQKKAKLSLVPNQNSGTSV